jgi:Cu+-exporting ATPase
MQSYHIPLSGLNCGKCVNKLKLALAALPETEINAIGKHSVALQSSQPLNLLLITIQESGYQGGYRHDLVLSGLGCGKCIGKVEAAFADDQNVSTLEVSKTALHYQGLADEQQVIERIEQLGYHASATPAASANPPEHQVTLSLTGLNCGKCVAKVKDAFAGQPGISRLEVDKTSLHFTGQLTEQQAIELVESLGYHAGTPGDQPKETTPAIPASDTPAEPPRSLPDNPAPASQVNLLLQGMTCASCVASVEKACLSAPGVQAAQVNLAEQSALITLSSAEPDALTTLIQAVQDAGYGARLLDDNTDQQHALQRQNQQAQRQHKQNAVTALLVGAPLMLWGISGGNMMIRNPYDQLAWGIVALVCLLLLATAGRGFYTSAWQSLTHRRATMDTLVALGTGAAWLYSTLVVLVPQWFPYASRHVYFEASAMIIGLISLGHYIEARAKERTTQSLQALIGLQPQTATLVQDGKERQVAISEVQLEMLLRIKPGEKVPVDGTVVEGESYINESMLTGEPLPILKQPGNTVSAGTINSDGSLLIQATGIGSHTMLARIIAQVRQAQSSKPAIARLADSVAAVFVPVVVAIALFAALTWGLIGPEPKASYMLVVSTTVLIIACPCALGLATPLSVTVGVGKAAELGILIRDADVLQQASRIDTVVFDKTGTLTRGEPEVAELTLANGQDRESLLTMAASLERLSEHPLAKAICRYADEHGATVVSADNFINQRGKGVLGEVNGVQVAVGSVSFLREQGIDVNDALVSYARENACSSVLVAINGVASAGFAIADQLKADSQAAVTQLKDQGIEVVLLSGDEDAVARHIGNSLGIDKVIARVLPDEKLRHIKQLQASGKTVAMVGDGINDAPALAQADIGIAMGSGTDVAIESAQMTLLTSSPQAVNSAIQLSRATMRNMRQNLFGAFVYNSLGIPVAAGALYPFTGFLLSPVIAGAAMALSSITVVSNANRLRLFRLKQYST